MYMIDSINMGCRGWGWGWGGACTYLGRRFHDGGEKTFLLLLALTFLLLLFRNLLLGGHLACI